MFNEINVEELLEEREQKENKKTKKARKTTKTPKPKKLGKREQQILDIANNTVLPEHYKTIWTSEDLREMAYFLKNQEEVAVDTETFGLNNFKDSIIGMSMFAPDLGFYIPLEHVEDIRHTEETPNGQIGVDYVKCLPKDEVVAVIKPILEDPKRKLILHNYKFDYHVLKNWLGIVIDCYFDTSIAQALLDENVSRSLKDLATYYLKIPADKFSKLFSNVTFNKVPIKLNPHTRTGSLASYYAIKDTELTFKLYKFQKYYLDSPRLEDIKNLFFNLEMPFVKIVAKSESRGVRLDEDYLVNTVAKQLHSELETLRQQIWSYTGEINLNSPQQKADVLYNKLKLPKVNKKSPFSTDKDTLNKLKSEHPVIPLLIDYSEKTKLTTAFADKLPANIVDGRVHTSFNTLGSATGRMSCSNPNMQQVPAKVGGLIRNAFIADEGRLLASIDFSL